jgi:hypothetical protein
MLSDNQEIARQRIAERIHTSERRTRLVTGQEGEEPPPGTRHRIAVALHRMADRVEPPARRTTLSFSRQ